MKKLNNKGIAPLMILGIILVIAIVGFTGYYVYNSNKNTSKTLDNTAKSQGEVQKITKTTSVTKEETSTSYDAAKVAKIHNFDTASTSLKEALINSFYDEAKKNCDEVNKELKPVDQWGGGTGIVMDVQKMVRDDFAGIQFCGSGATSVLVKDNGTWKVVTSLAEAPSCTQVDKYKISKEIVTACYENGATVARAVTYY